MKVTQLFPLQIQLYLLMFSMILSTYMSVDNKLFILPLFGIIALFVMLVKKLDKEFLLLNAILRNIRNKKVKSKINISKFEFQESKQMAAHLNDIISFHQKNITKAKYYNQSKREKDKLATSINLDEMTGLFKRNKFLEDTNKAFRKCFVTNENELFVAFLDIDHFKLVNDNHGHDAGDEVLIQFAKFIMEHTASVRKGEDAMACRWGGEEFVVMYFGMSEKDIGVLLEQFRKDVENATWPGVGRLTVSIGYTQINTERGGETVDTMVTRSDEGVYASKENGRNQITFIPGDRVSNSPR